MIISIHFISIITRYFVNSFQITLTPNPDNLYKHYSVTKPDTCC